MTKQELKTTAAAIVAAGKGILAADESTGTIKKRLASINVESTAENRRAYRQLLFTTEGMEKFISGVILFDETIRQKAEDGTPFPQVLAQKEVIPGIKVDKGKIEMPFHAGEMVTEGLDGLQDRLAEYRELGARFTKWRAVITIGDGIPTLACINANAHALGRFATLSQQAGLVPIVEPEVLMDGDHTIERCEEVTTVTLQRVFDELHQQGVQLEGMLLKPNMVLPGKEAPDQASPEEIAESTVRCFRRVVPAAVPGVVFLSGGQGPEEATRNLNAMNALGSHPWELSFSYGRALQGPVLEAWQGDAANVPQAQAAFFHRARMNGAARSGSYTAQMESEKV